MNDFIVTRANMLVWLVSLSRHPVTQAAAAAAMQRVHSSCRRAVCWPDRRDWYNDQTTRVFAEIYLLARYVAFARSLAAHRLCIVYDLQTFVIRPAPAMPRWPTARVLHPCMPKQRYSCLLPEPVTGPILTSSLTLFSGVQKSAILYGSACAVVKSNLCSWKHWLCVNGMS